MPQPVIADGIGQGAPDNQGDGNHREVISFCRVGMQTHDAVEHKQGLDDENDVQEEYGCLQSRHVDQVGGQITKSTDGKGGTPPAIDVRVTMQGLHGEE